MVQDQKKGNDVGFQERDVREFMERYNGECEYHSDSQHKRHRTRQGKHER